MANNKRRRQATSMAAASPQRNLSAKNWRSSRLLKNPLGFSPFFRTLSCTLRPRRSNTTIDSRCHGSSSKRLPSPVSTISDNDARDRENEVRDDEDNDSINEGRDDEENDSNDEVGSDEDSNTTSEVGEDEDSDTTNEVVDETVQVDFGFFDPKPGDFHGVKLLLRSYMGDREWDLSGFVDLILAQTTVGTVVKSENPREEQKEEEEEEEGDDEGPYAVISVLNLGRYAAHQCIKQLKNYIFELCCDDILKKKLLLMLGENGAHEVGLLICERFVNFPHQPVVPLYEGLFDEVSWATEDEPTQELRDSFKFTSYLILTRIFVRNEAKFKGRSSQSSLNKKSKSAESLDDESTVYVKVEDEILHRLCSSSFTFGFPRDEPIVPPELKGYKEMGLLMVLKSNKLQAFREELKLLLLEDN
ncbi:CDK inhibitor P21 binding protein [Wolffia australiana]